MSHIVTGLFKNQIDVHDAIRQLEMQGFMADQINVIAADKSIGQSFGIEKNNKSAEAGAAGATMGGIIGAVAAGLAATGSILIPGVNLVVYGALISAIAGAGAGAAIGGLAGALIGLGIPEYEVKHYENEVKGGSILVAVDAKTDERAKLVKDIFERQRADKIAA